MQKTNEIFHVTLQKKAWSQVPVEKICYEIPVVGPVSLNHQIFSDIEKILEEKGIVFMNAYGGREPKDYHFSWHTSAAKN